MTAVSPLRRSNRSCRKVPNIYDEAKIELEEKALTTSQQEETNNQSTDSESSDTDDDFERKPKRNQSTNPSPQTNQPKVATTTGGPKKVRVKLRPSPTRRTKTTSSNRTKTKPPPGQRPINNALASLARKVLHKNETHNSTSLVAALLSSYQTTPPQSQPQPSSPPDLFDGSSSQPRTIYTPQLTTIAQRIVSLHNHNPNTAQIHLLNLLFRSVGGTSATDLDPEERILEEMVDDDWGAVITDLVDEMRHTPADCVLLCSDPNGAVHAAAVEDGGGKNVPFTPSSLGVRAYRAIYQEFWYVLGVVALMEGSMSGVVSPGGSPTGVEDGGEPSTPKRTKKTTTPTKTGFSSTVRLDTELVRDLLTRVTGLVSVGQPDVRAAATLASLFLAHAIVDKTVFLSHKITLTTRQFDAAVGSKGGETTTTTTKLKPKPKPKPKKLSRKAEALKHQLDSLKRMRADLESIVLASVIQGVFVHRYRDSNMYIRSSCLDALGRMTVRRPDMFLSDKFLKYHGWMMSDKDEVVRISALEGLLLPFQSVNSAKNSGIDIDLSLMEHVITKFLPRIADSVIDVSVSVQESGMKLLLALLRTGLLDDIEDENMWNQINLCALANDTSPEVRRNALYFIMEQLEAFDEEDDGSNQGDGPNSKKEGKQSDRRATQRLDAIASWAAHALTDGQVPIEKIQIKLVNHLVSSLREMPEHKEIITNWSAILRAIQDDSVALTSQGTVAGDRADTAKQRVLVQMLAYSAKAEVGSVTDSNFMRGDVDPDVADALEEMDAAMKIGGNKTKKRENNMSLNGLEHEKFSVELIKALPHLLAKFKSDPTIVESLTSLPRYLISTVFSLPQQKKNFLDLTKMLSEIFLLSTDENVAQNTACSMIYLASNDHARLTEAKVAVKETVTTLHDRIVAQFMDKTKETQVDDVITGNGIKDVSHSSSKEIDTEHALYLNMKRMRIMAKRIEIGEYIANDEGSNVNVLEKLCNAIGDGLARRLAARKIIITKDDIEDTWDEEDTRYPGVVAGIVREGLQFLLSTLSWALLPIFEREASKTQQDNNAGLEAKQNQDETLNSFILSIKNRILSLVELCFEQFLPTLDDQTTFSKAQILWSDLVQQSGGKIASDLRTLLHRELANASSPFLREVSITDDSRLIGGFVRYFRSKEQEKLRCNKDGPTEDTDAVLTLLLPICRSLASNWKVGNRREAGVALAHITGSGSEASQVVTALSRLLKKVEPVRLLEAHMASLRQSYEEWINNDPEELSSDHPTDEEMAAFSEAEERHEEQFQTLINQAHRFSMSLGVNKLSDKKISPALLGFIREGIRFSFSASDDLVVGSRLSFLTLLAKYSHWVKKDPEYKKNLEQHLYERESSLKGDDEFDEVHEDDLMAVVEFRESLGLKASDIFTSSESVSGDTSTQLSNTMTPNSNYTGHQDDEESRDSVSDIKTPARSRRSSSIGISSNISSIESKRSLISSTRGSLSPLVEEDMQDDEESPQFDTQTIDDRTTENEETPLSQSQMDYHTIGSHTTGNNEESILSQSQLVHDYEENSQSDSQTSHDEEKSYSQSSQTRQVDEESSQSCSQLKQREGQSVQSQSLSTQGDEENSLSQCLTTPVVTKSNKRNSSDASMDSLSTDNRSQTQTTFDGEMSSIGYTGSNNESYKRKKARSS